MFQYVDPERFTDLFRPAGLQFSFQLVNRTAERVIFAATNADGTKAYLRKIRFLLTQCVLYRLQVIRNVSRTVR